MSGSGTFLFQFGRFQPSDLTRRSHVSVRGPVAYIGCCKGCSLFVPENPKGIHTMCCPSSLRFIGVFVVSLLSTATAVSSSGELTEQQILISVSVLDEDGSPVAGVAITPLGVRPGGGYYSWDAERYGEPTAVLTDAKGMARLSCPKYVEEKRETSDVHVKLEHRDFPRHKWWCPATSETFHRIVLRAGASLQVSGYVESPRQPLDSIYPHTDDRLESWSRIGDGKILSRNVPPGQRCFRLVAFPENKPTLYSKVVSFHAEKAQTYEFSLRLSPGTRLEGTLDDQVARPVPNGRICASVNHRAEHRKLKWYAWRDISPDGTFVFESLPPDGEIQLIAVCDAYVSKAPPDKPDVPLSQMRHSQRFELQNPVTKVIIAMEPAARCEVMVVDMEGQPVDGARVGFWPNVAWESGNTIFGYPSHTQKRLLSNWPPVSPKEFRQQYRFLGYSAITDSRGIAVISRLPGFDQVLNVFHDKYEVPITEVGEGDWKRTGRYAVAHLQAGKTSRTLVTMQPKGSEMLTNLKPKRVPIYDTSANGRVVVANALSRAREEKKRVLIQFGGNWCPSCYTLHDLLTEDDEIASVIEAGYVLAMVDALNDSDLLTGYAKDQDQYAYPFLTVLDTEGRVLVNKHPNRLEGESGWDEEKVKAFLRKWAPGSETNTP